MHGTRSRMRRVRVLAESRTGPTAVMVRGEPLVMDVEPARITATALTCID
jgi:hypothetical protein